MKMWQIKNPKIVEFLEILEIFFQFFSCLSFRFCPIVKVKNLDLQSLKKKKKSEIQRLRLPRSPSL